MARPRKVPAVLVEATVRGNAKLAALPSDTARLGFFYVVLGAAKTSEPVPGQFASRIHFRELAGRFARYVDDYIRVGVLEVAPRLCARCAARWNGMTPARGALVVHDWHEHQYDPRKIERQREYEERLRASQSDGVSDAQSDGVSDGVSDAIPTGDSRGGAPDRVLNVERRTENVESERRVARRSTSARATSGEATLLTKGQLDAWASFGPEWAHFKAAWLERGFHHPPSGDPDGDDTTQRGLLWQVLDARPTGIAEWVRGAPKGATARAVVQYVLDRFHEVRAAASDEPVERDLAPTRKEATEAVGAILGRLKAAADPDWLANDEPAAAKAKA
jgi:hypothetical protein